MSPFNDSTGELSEEKRVSCSKVISLLSVQHHAPEQELFQCMGIVQTLESTGTAESLRRPLMKSLYTLQSVSIMSLRHPGLKIIFSSLLFFVSLNKQQMPTSESAVFLQTSGRVTASSSSQPPITEKNPNVYKFVLAFLSTTASFVPCEGVLYTILCVACCPQ